MAGFLENYVYKKNKNMPKNAKSAKKSKVSSFSLREIIRIT